MGGLIFTIKRINYLPVRGLIFIYYVHAVSLFFSLLGSTADLVSMDKHWYGSVESSEWLRIVQSCLVVATEVTHLLCIKHTAVMLLGNLTLGTVGNCGL